MDGIRVRSAVVYGGGEVRSPTATTAELLLDLYQPAEVDEAGPCPVVVLIHGGGFRLQSRLDDGMVRIGRSLAEAGIAAASIDYRLAGQSPIPSTRVAPLLGSVRVDDLAPAVVAAVDDTLTAIDFLAAQGDELGLDPSRLGLVGSSAGAMTAVHVAYVLAGLGLDAPTVRLVGSLWGGSLAPLPDGAGTAEEIAALFAVHGDADSMVPVQMADDLVAWARRRGARTEYHRVAGAEHGYDTTGFFTRPVADEVTPVDRLVAFVLEEMSER